MKRNLVNLLLINLIFVNLLGDWQPATLPSPFLQSRCIKEAVGDAEIIYRQTLDVNGDGRKDQVVLYGKDDVYVAVALDQPLELCELVLDKRLTALKLDKPTIWRNIMVRKIEVIELTGDNIPELHVWLDKTGAPSRYEHVVHSVYSFTSEVYRKFWLPSSVWRSIILSFEIGQMEMLRTFISILIIIVSLPGHSKEPTRLCDGMVQSLCRVKVEQ